ncbi:uncharacterized protein LOC112513179 isoform X2 [Cynara cardunculus var. scolymus]|uniref:uncharacterized protein LOC112513179 isoform X2 n=1 Tax=Cynara cardunculus var. scolymus TaxID=59895 RepID=UPI000D62AC8A|nr:uncharacterized protein LOC112513179 isoform X2 [Cynara cardunculus var. scolymus]
MPESGSSMAILRWILDVFTFHRGYQIFVFLLVIVSSTETLILRSEVRLRRVNRVESASVNNDKGYAGDQQPRQVSPSQILQLYACGATAATNTQHLLRIHGSCTSSLQPCTLSSYLIAPKMSWLCLILYKCMWKYWRSASAMYVNLI